MALAGSKFDELGTKLFVVVCKGLLQHRTMTTAEMVECVQSNKELSGPMRDDERVTGYLKEMCAAGWLSRNDRNLWQIGPRSYLELSAYLQVCVLVYFAVVCFLSSLSGGSGPSR